MIDNSITETDADGNSVVRFTPLPAFETPDAMERLTSAYINAIEAHKYDPLLLTSMFVLDFLCIHPFNDGNGRMSRLLTLLLLYRSGYIVGKYISIEMYIVKTKETYYDTLSDNSIGWHSGHNNNYPFVKYYLEIVLGAYKEFDSRVAYLQNRKRLKPDRIKALFENSLQTLSKKMILEKCPDISVSTVETALSSLLKDGYIVKINAGKNTAYIRNITPSPFSGIH